MSKYKLLAVDMDGTLLNSQKKITPRTVAALAELAGRGVYVVTSTGRGRAEINDYPEAIKLMHYGILNSGGLLFDFVRDEPIAVHGVDEPTILQLIDFGLEERAMIHLLGVHKSLARESDIQNMAAFDMALQGLRSRAPRRSYQSQSLSPRHGFARQKPCPYAQNEFVD